MRYGVMVSPWDFGSQNFGSSPNTVAGQRTQEARERTATPVTWVRIPPLSLWLCSSEVEHLTEDQAVGVPKAPEATMAPSNKWLSSLAFQARNDGFDSLWSH